MKLRPAEVADLSTVLGWVASERECRLWAGPRIRYPATPESAWSELQASGENTYSFLDSARTIVAFGQVLPRDDKTVHLARLIVDPGRRGQGIGGMLCAALMNIGVSMHCAETFTLKVYESNAAAVRLYRSLGFAVTGTDKSGALSMTRLLPTASTRTGSSAAARE